MDAIRDDEDVGGCTSELADDVRPKKREGRRRGAASANAGLRYGWKKSEGSLGGDLDSSYLAGN